MAQGSETASRLIEAGRRQLLRHADAFSRRGDERIQARELLEHVAGDVVGDDEEIDRRTQRRFHRLIERRTTGEPVPYIRGYEVFRGLHLAVRPGAFIPRQSTEFLAEQALRRLRHRKNAIAADLATGVGAVAIAMASTIPGATIYGTDISTNALRLARANARSHRLSNVRMLRGSMFEPLPRRLRGSIDVITSHPPYVASNELGELPAELIRFEPMESLTDASDDGFGLVKVLVAGGLEWLKPGGSLCIEVGSDLSRRVRSMMIRAGYVGTRSTRGVVEESRVVVAKRPPADGRG